MPVEVIVGYRASRFTAGMQREKGGYVTNTGPDTEPNLGLRGARYSDKEDASL